MTKEIEDFVAMVGCSDTTCPLGKVYPGWGNIASTDEYLALKALVDKDEVLTREEFLDYVDRINSGESVDLGNKVFNANVLLDKDECKCVETEFEPLYRSEKHAVLGCVLCRLKKPDAECIGCAKVIKDMKTTNVISTTCRVCFKQLHKDAPVRKVPRQY